MAVEWTNEQKTAINLRERGLLVSAGAGSGKTAVLAERICGLVARDGISPSRIMVATFTKAAANEMKKRIRTAITSSSSQAGKAELLAGLEEAHIGTIHSFCHWVVSNYYQLAGVDPSFKVLGDEQATSLRFEAMHESLANLHTAGDYSLLEAADKYSNRNEDEFATMLIELFLFSQNRIDPAGWIGGADAAYSPGGIGILEEKLTADIIGKLDHALSLSNWALGICIEHNSDEKRHDYFRDLRDEMVFFKSILVDEGLEAFFNRLDVFKLARYAMRKPFDFAQEAKDAHASIKEAVDKLKKTFAFPYSDQISALGRSKSAVSAICRVLSEFNTLYREKKAEANSLDYSDLEHLCYAVLADSQVAQEVAGMFDYVFVDEYQDTSEIQEAIITAISHSEKICCVGDIKQSIYSFRSAEPAIFVNRYNRYLQQSSDGDVVFLNKNFRTSPSLIDSVNFIFDRIFTKDTGGVDYLPDERMSAGQGSGGENAIIALAKSGSGRDEGDEDQYEENAYIEGKMIAKIIAQTVREGVVDGKTGLRKLVGYRDIAVISRTLEKTRAGFEQALAEAGIPVQLATPANFASELETAVIANILALVDNESDDVAMAGAMRSFAFGISPTDSIRIRASLPQAAKFTDCCRFYAIKGEMADLRKRLQALYEAIARYRLYSRHMGLGQLARLICQDICLASFVSALEDAPGRLENIDKLFSMADEYEASRANAGISGFLAHLRLVGQRTSNRSVGNNDDAVVITSIHSAKGLEYEVAIIASCSRRFNMTRTTQKVIADKDLGICVENVDLDNMVRYESYMSIAAKSAAIAALKSEEMRLLYVAMTRAKNKLVLAGIMPKKGFGHIKLAGEPTSYGLLGANCYLDWIQMAFGMTAKGESIPWSFWEEQEADSGIYPLAFGYGGEKGGSAADDDAFSGSGQTAPAFGYKYKLDSSIPSKVAASALGAAEPLGFGERLINAKPPSFGQARFAAERGAATHSFLQKMDFARFKGNWAAGDLQGELDLLLQSGVLSEKEHALVDLGMISGFLSGFLGKKIINAKSISRETSFIMALPAAMARAEWAASKENIVVQGTIDCYFEYEGKTFLVDYKTDRIEQAASALADAAKRHEGQILVYREAIKEAYGKYPDESYICFLDARLYWKVGGDSWDGLG
ncbi:MAG: UvrD-helicase domain-containing protein [Eubacteriaceae bacterium]|nr:UvrD-helicase domain-containing protein [Eubacteriaceae bacterium]